MAQQVFSFLGQVVLLMESDEAERCVLWPILAHADDEVADSLIHPFLDALVAVGVLDAPELDPNALRYIQACRDRILNNRAWRGARRDKGEIYGIHLPHIVRTLFFIVADHAPAAAGLRMAIGVKSTRETLKKSPAAGACIG